MHSDRQVIPPPIAILQELFSTTIGPLRKLAMSYRANGQSTGQVTVEFQKSDDAAQAYQKYNNRLIDGSEYARGARRGCLPPPLPDHNPLSPLVVLQRRLSELK